MAIRHQRSVGFGLSSALSAFVLSACAAPAAPVRPGALELRLEPEASYALVGRFHVNAIDPYSPSRDVDFDIATPRARIELPAGTFALLLGAGARLVCAGEQPEALSAPAAIPRLVSASPQVISIAPGELTTAHISFGASPASGQALGANSPTEAPDPCGSRQALTELAAWR
jgi:hypothetical protein